MRLVTLVALITLSSFCDAYKILVVFPLPGKSHSILGEGYVRKLLDAGHEVTYIAGIPYKHASPKLRQIDVNSNKIFLNTPATTFDIGNLINEKTKMVFNMDFAKVVLLMANATIMNEEVQKLINDPREEFDVVIIEYMFSELYTGLSSVFNCPYIWSSSVDPHGLVLSLIDEDPSPAYVPDIMSNIIPPFTFTQRVAELWKVIKAKYIKWKLSSEEELIFEQAFGSAVAKRGRKLPPLADVRYNSSFMLGNSHVSAGQATRLPQNYVAIAGYHIQDTVKPLPDLILTVFSSSPMADFSLPQKLFTMAFVNVNRAVHRGFAKQIHLDYNMHTDLKAAVVEILGNPRYRERVKQLSFIYHDRPVPPGKELVHWVEHVVRTRGAPHLRSPALMLPWYQKCYLDLLALIILGLIVFGIMVKFLLAQIKKTVKRKTQ